MDLKAKFRWRVLIFSTVVAYGMQITAMESYN